jgi:hypothetical protein
MIVVERGVDHFDAGEVPPVRLPLFGAEDQDLEPMTRNQVRLALKRMISTPVAMDWRVSSDPERTGKVRNVETQLRLPGG